MPYCCGLLLPCQVEEGLCQLVAMLWLDSQDFWAKQQQGGYQERLLSYLGYQVGAAAACLHACMHAETSCIMT